MICDNSCSNNCGPAPYNSRFSIQPDPFNPAFWNVSINGETNRIKIPKLNETCTSLSTDFSNATMNYIGECRKHILTGRQIGSIINLDDLRDVESKNPAGCSMLVWNSSCNSCNDDCQPIGEAWRPYHISDATKVATVLDDGYYRVLAKNGCGCPVEVKLPVAPKEMTTLDYVRDSVPDDPDFPWYYGAYNDKINLYLERNAPKFFGKYALKVTINYGVQVIHSEKCPNANWRSLVVPVVEGEEIRVGTSSSILQGFAMHAKMDSNKVDIPWGTMSMRGTITFIVPKGKEAYLHHEFRLRTNSSFPNYYTSSADGQKVPDNEATINNIKHNASRLNALQVIIEPTQGASNYTPHKDADRDQLDSPIDEYKETI